MKKPLFAICDPAVTGYVNGPAHAIKITQKPNEAAKLTLGGVDWETTAFFAGNAILRLEAYEYGVDILDSTDSCQDFTARGEIFHPLKEEKLGVENPYADPDRGLIRDISLSDMTNHVDTDDSTWYT